MAAIIVCAGLSVLSVCLVCLVTRLVLCTGAPRCSWFYGVTTVNGVTVVDRMQCNYVLGLFWVLLTMFRRKMLYPIPYNGSSAFYSYYIVMG